MSSRVICTGASRFTRSARSTCSAVKLSSLPDAGRCRVGDQHVDRARLGQQRLGGAGRREIADDRAVPTGRDPDSEAANSSSSWGLRELTISRAPRSASALAIALPNPPVAPVSRTVLPVSFMGTTVVEWVRHDAAAISGSPCLRVVCRAIQIDGVWMVMRRCPRMPRCATMKRRSPAPSTSQEIQCRTD